MQWSTGAADGAGEWAAGTERAAGSEGAAGSQSGPSFDEVDALVAMPRVLADLAEGRLSSAETDAVVAWLQASATEPPPWLVNRAVRIARQAPDGRRAGPTMWRRLVASLVYDSHLQVRPIGARGAGADHLRLMYQAGGIEIDLEVGESSTEGRLRMLGQITDGDTDLAGAWVIAEGPAGRTETRVDELGQFVLDGLVAGEHRMEIGLPCELIEIPELQI